jgi:Holliday junction DNA helicase RuvA
MIASINGKIVKIEAHSIIVEVGGVGLLISIPNPLRDQLRLGETIFLHTYLVVRQDALSLYGFDTSENREFFILLLGVDGIGPRLAMAVLSTLSPDTIRRAVLSEQADIFCRVPGVGKKTSQKMLLYLQGRVIAVEGMAPIAAMSDLDTEVLSALTSLGYSVVEAQAALQSIPRETPLEIEPRLRIALQYFGS